MLSGEVEVEPEGPNALGGHSSQGRMALARAGLRAPGQKGSQDRCPLPLTSYSSQNLAPSGMSHTLSVQSQLSLRTVLQSLIHPPFLSQPAHRGLL